MTGFPVWLQDLRRLLAVGVLRLREQWRERLPAVAVVAVSGWLVWQNLAAHDDPDEYAGFAFLAAAIAYAIYASRRARWQRLARTPTVRGVVWLCLGLLVANWLLANMLGTAAAVVGTLVLAAGFVWSLRERPPERTPFRRLLVAFAFSLLPLGWMAFDYWSLLGEEYELSRDRVSEELRAKVRPVLADLAGDIDARVARMARIRRRDELVLQRLDDLATDPYVDFAFFLPERPDPVSTFVVRRDGVVPVAALSPSHRKVFEAAAARLYARRSPRGPIEIGGHMAQSRHSGYGYLKHWSVRRDGHYGVMLSMHRLATDLGARRLADANLAGKVRLMVAPTESRPGEVVLISQDEMPEDWGFAQVVVEPEAFAKAQQAVDFKRLIAQIWFGFLVVWLAAAFYNMYRTATRDMALADMKSNFVSSVTHELKTPLGMIRMYTEMLQLGLVGEGKKQEDYLHVIAEEADRLARLIDNVLDFSKIQQGTKRYEFGPVDLREVAEAALRNLEGAFAAAGKAAELVAPETNVVVRADRDAALQAVLNLLSNAIKYGGRSIRVELARVGSEAHLAVRDDGPGIPLAEQRNVFQPFYRLGREEERTTAGTGLGLALVSEIMRAHHGSVTLGSQPGLATTFTLVFPASATIEEQAA
ncbi:MAG: HAMP domain-containing histidine kinase [Candidatus Sericytochromatia bacterium]|nr:HAMP domain-containing histidine kinase [Candidatus Tanganyikabacteria bacterium]